MFTLSGAVLAMLEWLPASLQLICIGVVAIFVISTIMRLVSFVLDIIPFVR